jgi:hypothetical protein
MLIDDIETRRLDFITRAKDEVDESCEIHSFGADDVAYNRQEDISTESNDDSSFQHEDSTDERDDDYSISNTVIQDHDDETEAFLALNSGNESHIPGRFETWYFHAEDHLKLLRKAEVVCEDGTIRLNRIVHMIDRDIFLFKHIRPNCYRKKESYKCIRDRYSLDSVNSYNIKQAKLQAFYFKHLLLQGVYSKDELVDKIYPYFVSSLTMLYILKVAMNDAGKKTCGSSSEFRSWNLASTTLV